MCWRQLTNRARGDLDDDVVAIQRWVGIIAGVLDPVRGHVGLACPGSPVFVDLAGGLESRQREVESAYRAAEAQVVAARNGEPEFWYKWRPSCQVDGLYYHVDFGTRCFNPFGYQYRPGLNYVVV